MALKLDVNGQTRIFRSTGEVAVLENNQETPKGTWRSDDLLKDNKFRYDLDGVEQTPLDALYSFNDQKQLQVTLRSGGAQSDPFAFAGGIEIDDNHDVVYNLIGDHGASLNKKIVVYGDIRFEEGTNALVIKLAGGGGDAKIEGDTGIESIEASENHIEAFQADDLLKFHVTTFNVAPDGSINSVEAKIEFVGSWDIQSDNLVFVSKIKGDPLKPEIKLGFAGKIGAVSGGFVYFADSSGTQAAFQIQGQHVWGAGDTKTEFNWESSLGFSEKKFSAKVAFDVNSARQEGRKLALKGNMTLLQEGNAPLNIALALEAEYEWKNNQLVFKASVSKTNDDFNYDLMLEGKFHFAHSDMQFSIKYSNNDSDPGLSVALAVQGDRENAIKALAFHLQISEGEASVKISVDFEVRMRFIKGVGRVLEPVAAVSGD